MPGVIQPRESFENRLTVFLENTDTSIRYRNLDPA